LQKSAEFEVVNCSDQIEAQGKSLSAITIPFTQDPKDLQLTKNMLNQNSFSSQGMISLLFLFGQRMIFGFLERRLAILMKVCQALVASIRQNSNVLCNVEFLILEKLEVMFATLAEGGGYNFSRLLVGNQLRFLSVSLLFAAVVLFLAFFGRSTGCSLTSTSTTSKIVSLGRSACLPGKRNCFERTRASSTLWMVRQTVASLIP
jgi:hypothetical protein